MDRMMEAASGASVGRSYPGLKNKRLVAGRGTFVNDINLPRMAHLAVVRSPHPHARILDVDGAEALRIPGVLRVMTGEEVRRDTHPIPTDSRVARDRQPVDLYALSADEVRFVGDPVAAVVAEDRYAARLAAERVHVKYQVLPAVLDAEQALEPSAPLVVPAWDDNVLVRRECRHGDPERAFREADGVVRGLVRCNRVTGAPIETRGSVARFDPYEELLTFWSSTQTPHPLRVFLADALGLPENRIRVIQPDVGGAFGLKLPMFPEDVLVATLSQRLGRPVKWIEERAEHFQVCGHARDTRARYEAAYRRDGTVVGLKVRLLADLGAPSALLGWASAVVTWTCLPGLYRIANVETELAGVLTHKCPWNAYRGFGKDAACFIMERVMDHVARATGVDRAEVRFRNFIEPTAFPYQSPSGAIFDSGNYPEVLRRLLQRIDYAGFRELQRKARAEGRHIGLGIAVELAPEGAANPEVRVTAGYDGATVRVDSTGTVSVMTGVTSPGSGNETAIAQIAADELGCAVENVRMIQGDTDTCPWGLGNHSSRSVMYGGGAVALACREVRRKMLNLASKMLETAPSDLEVRSCRIHVAGAPSRSVSFQDVAVKAYRNVYGRHMEDLEPALEATRYFRMENVHHQADRDGRFNNYPIWSNGATACIVEVDPEDGSLQILRYCFVHDAGRLINPLLAEGNLHGGIAQGIGGALYEQVAYDDAGQLLTSTFMDYTIPTAVEVPAIELEHLDTPSPFTLLGAKGVGESGLGSALGACCAAVEDAFPELNLWIDHLPVTPYAVWKAIVQATGEDGQVGARRA